MDTNRRETPLRSSHFVNNQFGWFNAAVSRQYLSPPTRRKPSDLQAATLVRSASSMAANDGILPIVRAHEPWGSYYCTTNLPNIKGAKIRHRLLYICPLFCQSVWRAGIPIAHDEFNTRNSSFREGIGHDDESRKGKTCRRSSDSTRGRAGIRRFPQRPVQSPTNPTTRAVHQPAAENRRRAD